MSSISLTNPFCNALRMSVALFTIFHKTKRSQNVTDPSVYRSDCRLLYLFTKLRHQQSDWNMPARSSSRPFAALCRRGTHRRAAAAPDPVPASSAAARPPPPWWTSAAASWRCRATPACCGPWRDGAPSEAPLDTWWQGRYYVAVGQKWAVELLHVTSRWHQRSVNI